VSRKLEMLGNMIGGSARVHPFRRLVYLVGPPSGCPTLSPLMQTKRNFGIMRGGQGFFPGSYVRFPSVSSQKLFKLKPTLRCAFFNFVLLYLPRFFSFFLLHSRNNSPLALILPSANRQTDPCWTIFFLHLIRR
jgi:hypothetical protein